MSTAECVRCGRPLSDAAFVCHADAQKLAETLLAAAGHAEDAWTVIARQARYGAGSRGGSDGGLPANLRASREYLHADVTAAGWARILVEEGYASPPPRWRPAVGPLCPPRRPGHEPPGPGHGWRCEHGSCTAIRDRTPPAQLAQALGWLAAHTEQLRHHPAAAEAFRDLHLTAQALERLVDRPAGGDRLVGMCDCGKILYAPHGRDVVRCRACGAKWNVTESQEILLGHLDGKLVTVPEALDMAGWLDTDRTREQIRKLVTKWIGHGLLVAHGQVAGGDDAQWPTYRFGEIRLRLAETPRRNREGARV